MRPSLIGHLASVDVKQHESKGADPGTTWRMHFGPFQERNVWYLWVAEGTLTLGSYGYPVLSFVIVWR